MSELFQCVREFHVAERGRRGSSPAPRCGCCGATSARCARSRCGPTRTARASAPRSSSAVVADARALGLPRVIALTREVEFFERCGFVVVQREAPAAQGVDRLREVPAPPRLRRGRGRARPGARRRRGRREGRAARTPCPCRRPRRPSAALPIDLVTEPPPMSASPPVHLVDLLGLERAWVLGPVRRRRPPARRCAARRAAPRPLAGQDRGARLPQAVAAHARVVHGRHARAGRRRRGPRARRGERAPAARACPTSRTCSRAWWTWSSSARSRTRWCATLAAHATVPVINALTDHSHPCQILADLYTLWRAGRDLDSHHGRVGRRRQQRAALVARGRDDLRLRACASRCRTASSPTPGCSSRPSAAARAACAACATRSEAVRGADVVYTDTWTSMGQEEEAEWRRVAFAGYPWTRR